MIDAHIRSPKVFRTAAVPGRRRGRRGGRRLRYDGGDAPVVDRVDVALRGRLGRRRDVKELGGDALARVETGLAVSEMIIEYMYSGLVYLILRCN